MVLKLKSALGTYGLKVYTDSGSFFGEVDEAIIQDNRIVGWRVKAGPTSSLSKMISGAKGAIVNHSLVRAIDDIFIISSVVTAPSEAEQQNV
jgi:sporulation protein YlmC with PRC-barrel domain